MSLGLFHFFLRLPVLAFRMAGIVRVSNRAKRRFRRELVESGLPDEIVEELVNYFNPSTPLRETLFRFSRR
ncbi:hypothetical protein AMR53_11270 [Thermococcus thioreducens]|uniref:Transposase n=1 Tax=Thermococcus thioreducens TaxID=277988 RepID=A0A0Q2XK48_9EURY|nr:hypothetical protein AMR53_11270 [Thermococcus thioreducens]SEV82615.1 hypothetical protein SAMN05216170_0171 [Thermococcus thioreducens]